MQRTVIDGDAAQLKDARKRLEDGQAAVAEAREEVELLKQALPGARANAIKAIREVIGKEISRLQEKFLKQRIPLQNELAAAIQSLAMPILLADRAVSVFDQSAPALRWGNKDLIAEFGALPAELQSDPAAPQESGPQHDFWDGRGPKPPSPPRPFELEAFPERPLMNRDAVEILGTGPIVSAGPQGIF